MRRREAVAALIAGALIILALLAVFAITLSNNQARSRSVVEAQAHQRAVLVAGLIDSVFSAISRPGPQSLAEYGRAAVSDRALTATGGPTPTSYCSTATAACWRLPGDSRPGRKPESRTAPTARSR